ncbi:2-amino-4-hydroxy-6-hydroxymethyldihydropteridine diphosphokinase, partial [Bacteroidota bacterium]
REENLKNCHKRLSVLFGKTLSSSSIYESESWGFDAEPFLNQVIIINTKTKPESLLEEILRIENEMGRKRNNTGYESRIIDIDILFYGSIIYKSKNLVIPHPLLQERMFILEPLNEIRSEYIHPVIKLPISNIYLNCTDTTKLKKYKTQYPHDI